MLLLSLFVALVVLAPAIDVTGYGYSSSTVSAKGGNGKGHGNKASKGKGHSKHGKKDKGTKNHGDNGERKGNGKKKGHHKIEEATLAAEPLAQTVVTPIPLALPSSEQPSEQPSESPPTTGTILVIVYECPAGIDPETVDWYTACTTFSSGVTFRVVKAGAPDNTAETGMTDDRGNLTLTDLDPGTYHLTEETGDWCHAESDSVDENGDVIVRAGERSTVWIFHCPPGVTT